MSDDDNAPQSNMQYENLGVYHLRIRILNHKILTDRFVFAS